MYLSVRARWVLRAFCALVLVVLYAPILYVARLSVNTATNYAWPPTRLHARVVAAGAPRAGPTRGAPALGADRAVGDRDRARARHPGRVRADAAPVLRSQRRRASSSSCRSRSRASSPASRCCRGSSGSGSTCRSSRSSSPTRPSASSSSTTTSAARLRRLRSEPRGGVGRSRRRSASRRSAS